jgi:hypothetical protein
MDHNQADKSDWHAEGWTIAALSCVAVGFGAIALTMWIIPTTPERALTGDWIGGIFGACAGLASAFLLFGALRLQRTELSLQRKELADTREEMKLAREVHEASRRELEEQTRIARRAAHLEHISSAIRSLRALPEFKRFNILSYVTDEYRASEDYLCQLLKSDLLLPYERMLLIKQLGLSRTFEGPDKIKSSACERNGLEIEVDEVSP